MKTVKYNYENIKLPFNLKSTECEELTTEEVEVKYLPTFINEKITLPRFANGVYLATLNALTIGNVKKYNKGKQWLEDYFPYTYLKLIK